MTREEKGKAKSDGMEKSDNEISWDLLGLKCQKNLQESCWHAIQSYSRIWGSVGSLVVPEKGIKNLDPFSWGR